MRKTGLILILCLLFGQVGCGRKAKSAADPGPVSSESPAGGHPGSAKARTNARGELERGKELYRNDEDSAAAEAFAEAARLDPELAEAHFRLGLAYEALGKAEEAERAYRKAVETFKVQLAENADDPEGQYLLGQTYGRLHSYTEAVRAYRQAVRLKPDDPDIHYDLGVALMRLAQYNDAATAFQKCLDLDPEYYRAQDALAEAREGVKRIQTARKHQEELLKKQQEEEEKAGKTDATTPGGKKN
jgi:cytochrome c-type biogenesis protein CcmH/NrfG